MAARAFTVLLQNSIRSSGFCNCAPSRLLTPSCLPIRKQPQLFQFKGYSVATSNKLEVNGINFHYERAGNGEHVVLLLPGGIGHSDMDFRPQIDGLNHDKYTIISFDYRGCGKSRPPDRHWPLYFHHRDAEDAAAFMQKLGFPRYSILGWSDGGITGLIMAAAYPGNVKKLLEWGANAYVADLAMYTDFKDTDKWSERRRGPFIALYGLEHFRTLWGEWNEAMIRIVQERDGDICIGSLPNIKCKTLIINGHKDTVLPQEHPKFLQKHIPNSRIIDWPEGKHNLHLSFHKEFNKTAEAFLDEPE